MGRPPRWKQGKIDAGVIEIVLSSWKYFSDFVNQELLDYTTYIYRGHGDAAWKLEPTIDRKIKSPTSPKREEHLLRFKYETRGRRGGNPPDLEHEDDWWALGQHHGLKTPLLDWTESPFVALYFAAASAQTEKSKRISVFALSQAATKTRNVAVRDRGGVAKINGRFPTVKIVRPLSDENSRLVSQRGVFTRSPNNMDLETWVKEFHDGVSRTGALIKLTVPTTGLQDCLRYLNRMNINHSTLFPDLMGASEFCNKPLVSRHSSNVG